MRKDAIKRLERHVTTKERIENTNRMNIMVKRPPRMGLQQLVQTALSRMAKWRMAKVMSKRYCFDKIAVKVQSGADITGNARNELYMQATARQIIVATKAKDLGFAV